MTKNSFRPHPVQVATGAALFALAAGPVLGAGFALQEQNASGLGHAYAGGAAAAEDVSTIFYNPAGLVRLQSMQAVVAGNLICPSAKFRDSGSQQAAFQPLGGTGGDAGSCAFVPNIYVGIPFTDKWSFGIGVNVPFGLKTEYDDDWLGRFQAIKSEVQTYNINPVISWEPTKSWTVGGGVSFQHLKAELTNNVNYAALFAQGVGVLVANGTVPGTAAPTLIGSANGLQSFVKVKGDDSSWGWNVGVLWQATPQTRIGAAYRSSIKYDVDGNVSFTNPTATGALPATLAPVGQALVNNINSQLFDGGVRLHIKLPETANLSVFYTFDDRKWDLMADVQYTGWSTIEQLQVVRTTGAVLSTTPENFRDTWRFSVGANYRWDDKWTFRGGFAWDQTPVRDAERTPRLPDEDRTWAALGVQYKFSDAWAVDLAYAYIWIRDASMNQNAGNTAANGLINGNYKSNVNILGVQLTYTAK